MSERFSITPDQQAKSLLDKLLEAYGGSKSDVVNLLAEKYQTLLNENDLLREQLSEERRLSKGTLRTIEQRLNVLYEVENTRQNYEAFPELLPTSKEKSKIIIEAEDQVELDRKNRVFNHYEKLRRNP
ncbi:hypothetical protein GQR36_27050 [Enterococcus termitis]